jgi:CRP-like cAMP-binding protein
MHNKKLNHDDSENITSHFDGGTIKHFSKGEVLVQGDEEPKGVYLIQVGYVKAYTISRTGQQNLLLIHGVNEIMPLPWGTKTWCFLRSYERRNHRKFFKR